MGYYLDTNALRSLNSLLPDDSRKKGIYTSMLAIVEIISGLKNDFQRKRNILLQISQKKVIFVDRFPEEMLLASYGIFDTIFKTPREHVRSFLNELATLDSYDQVMPNAERYRSNNEHRN